MSKAIQFWVGCLCHVIIVAGRSVPGDQQGLEDTEEGLITERSEGIRDFIGEPLSDTDQGFREFLSLQNEQVAINGDLNDPDEELTQVIDILLKSYCQLLRNRAAEILPEVCFTSGAEQASGMTARTANTNNVADT